MAKIAYLTNAHPASGVGHRAARLRQKLSTQLTIDEYRIDGATGAVTPNDQLVLGQRSFGSRLHPKTIAWLTLGWRLRSRLHHAHRYDLWHATNQTLSFIVTPDVPSIVTVHDIIEVLEPQSRLGGMTAHYLYRGIPRATHVIAVSKFTARTLREHYGVPAARITVIPNGVGAEFHPMPDFTATVGYQTLREELKLTPEQRVILYVGSDHPRKNVGTIINVLAQLRRRYPELMLVKVGEPGLPAERGKLLTAIDAQGVRDHVRFVSCVTTARLNELYNLASVLLFPSRLEGFGLPPLQALAAGLPVVCSNATALPEVVGDAALTADPDDIDALAAHVHRVLSDTALAEQLREKGLQRAKLFTWERAAVSELAVYRHLLGR